jgi:hypothetical protein
MYAHFKIKLNITSCHLIVVDEKGILKSQLLAKEILIPTMPKAVSSRYTSPERMIICTATDVYDGFRKYVFFHFYVSYVARSDFCQGSSALMSLTTYCVATLSSLQRHDFSTYLSLSVLHPFIFVCICQNVSSGDILRHSTQGTT